MDYRSPGNKCKYFHPERGNQPQKLVCEKLAERASPKLREVKARKAALEGSHVDVGHTKSTPLPSEGARKKPLTRTHSNAPAQASEF